ncbi:hypothetical protein ACLI09_06165 [Flavobacterium sp. RHBU_24]|uniref:hypothetical protein n=1 Tax=Flavobacterium sp. RHBU_24 TaxID=3391185 RepID=UPI003985022A
MRMLLLFPNIFIMSVAGYNLFSELGSANTYYMPIALHATVVIISVLFISLIIRSAFKVRYVEENN